MLRTIGTLGFLLHSCASFQSRKDKSPENNLTAALNKNKWNGGGQRGKSQATVASCMSLKPDSEWRKHTAPYRSSSLERWDATGNKLLADTSIYFSSCSRKVHRAKKIWYLLSFLACWTIEVLVERDLWRSLVHSSSQSRTISNSRSGQLCLCLTAPKHFQGLTPCPPRVMCFRAVLQWRFSLLKREKTQRRNIGVKRLSKHRLNQWMKSIARSCCCLSVASCFP